jgi:hypothetical protein
MDGSSISDIDPSPMDCTRLKHSAGVAVGNISNITEIPSMDSAST